MLSTAEATLKFEANAPAPARINELRLGSLDFGRLTMDFSGDFDPPTLPPPPPPPPVPTPGQQGVEEVVPAFMDFNIPDLRWVTTVLLTPTLLNLKGVDTAPQVLTVDFDPTVLNLTGGEISAPVRPVTVIEFTTASLEEDAETVEATSRVRLANATLNTPAPFDVEPEALNAIAVSRMDVSGLGMTGGTLELGPTPLAGVRRGSRTLLGVGR